MDEYYFSRDIGEGKLLCLAPLTNRLVELSGESIEDQSGYFLFEKAGPIDGGDVEIIAQVPTLEAVWRLRDLLELR